jgi:hypothetical protein
MRMPPVAGIAPMLFTAALLSGCGSAPAVSDSAQQSGSTESIAQQRRAPSEKKTDARSVCTMIPKAEMETILGGALTSAEAKDAPGRSECTYVGFGRYAGVAIEWGNGEAGMAGARLAAKFMGATAGSIPVMTPIEGLGDEATLMIGGVLSVRKGDDLITVDLRTNKNAEVTGPDIARKIIERM